MRETSMTTSVDLDAEGVQHGHLILPHSRDDSAWGSLQIPITVLRNGKGPTALLTGGNHGDEYEGPLALVDLAATLAPEQITGCVIIIPFMNLPAFRAGSRTSPFDGGNMNRIFPGRSDGTPSEKIADYFQRYLLPRADVVLDFHSGGRSLDFLPFAACHILDDAAQFARCRAARDAFNAPFSLEMREIDAVGMYDDAAEALGKTFVTTELGGGASTTPETVSIARKGMRNLLIHEGILDGTPERAPSRSLIQPGDDCFHFASDGGMIEYMATLGSELRRGDVIARIWETGHTGRAPQEISAKMSGLLIARHFPGLVQQGDCVAVMAVEVFET
ncbi:MAG: N-alpha-acetyl diaminobutyric acid deacetylase DoeB [Litoreibacter sp.]|nr:N-alpha-acetyl diaminobutyric acid deacetylase DoeB [Litoreibacter sp.]